jgi:hypothetical protein
VETYTKEINKEGGTKKLIMALNKLKEEKYINTSSEHSSDPDSDQDKSDKPDLKERVSKL